jgi:hypothetical protein
MAARSSLPQPGWLPKGEPGPSARLQAKAESAYQQAALGPLNRVVHPYGGWWWLPLLVLVWVFGILPRWRARTPVQAGYWRPGLTRWLHAPGWAPLGWIAAGLSLWFLALLHPALGPAWAPSAWFGIQVAMPRGVLDGLVNLGSLVVLGGLGLALYRGSRAPLHAGEHGAAAWATFRDVLRAGQPRWAVPLRVHYRGSPKDWPADSSEAGVVMWCPPDAVACTHYLLVGGTGSGKTESLFNHVLGSCRGPVIYQDVKGECPMLDHPSRKGAIRWGCAAKGGWPSLRWNPLEECRRIQDPARAETAWQCLAEMLLPAKNHNDASWVEEIGRPILAEGLREGQYGTLAEFAETVRDIPLQQLLEGMALPLGLTGLMKGKNVPEYVAMSFYSAMAIYREGWARAVTSGHDFSLEELLARGGYVLSVTGSLEGQGAPVRLFWRMLFTYLLTSRDRHPVTILLDEGLAAGKLPNLQQALVTLRAQGVSLVMGIQSETGLLDIYSPTTGRAILDAFGNRILMLHGLDPTDIETWSKRLGSWTKTRRGRGRNGTPSTAAVPLLTPSEMARRGRRLKDRWMVLDCRESTRSGLPIIGRALEAGIPTRMPSAAEIQAAHVPSVPPLLRGGPGRGQPQARPGGDPREGGNELLY